MSAHMFTNGTTGGGVVTHIDTSWHKPLGRGRRFERRARALARRLRIPFVRSTIWERDHPESRVGWSAVSYGPPWISDHCLADFSFACQHPAHKGERYNRKRGR